MNIERLSDWIMGLAVVLWLAWWIAIAYVLIHFISKWW